MSNNQRQNKRLNSNPGESRFAAAYVEQRAHKPRLDAIVEIFGAALLAGVILWVAIAGISWAISAVAGLL